MAYRFKRERPRSLLPLAALASLRRISDRQSRSQAAKRWRDAPALTGWSWSGSISARRPVLGRLQPLPELAPKAPVNRTAIVNDAGNLQTDPALENGLPGDEREAEPPVSAESLKHREPAAREIG